MDIFCKIVKGELPSYTIYEDEIVKVLLDINQKCVGHSLIIPKKHYTNIYDIDDKTLNHILKIAKKTAVLLKEKLKIDGLTLIENNELNQEIKHFHLHLIPAYKENKSEDIEETFKIITN